MKQVAIVAAGKPTEDIADGELTTYRSWLARQAWQIALPVRREQGLYQRLRLTA